MRIAVISDIHGNLTALEAVIADLRDTAPDIVLQGGDLAAPGSRPAEVLDRIRDLGWPGVLGNTDAMLTRPESLTQFAAQSKAPRSMWDAVTEMADASRRVLGEQRLAWLATLPLAHVRAPLSLVHASPGDCWRSPAADATDEQLSNVYAVLAQPLVVFGHIHVPFVRPLPGLTIANSGSVGQPLDGDQRASYLLVDESGATIRRVEYDVQREVRELRACGLPHAEWLVKMLEAARLALP